MNAKTPSIKKQAPTPAVARKAAPVATVPLVMKQKTAAQPTKVTKSPVTDRPKAPSPIVSTTPANAARGTKQARLITLLQAKSGATIDQIREVTGWQAHSVRGTISGVLRKKLGYQVTCAPSPGNGARLYHIIGTSAA